MKFPNLLLITVILIFSASAAFSQKKSENKVPESIRSSAAFAELVLRMTELESDIADMLTSYTEEYPKVKTARYELKLLQYDLEFITLMKEEEAGKLTLALGKLLVRRAAIATDYWVLKSRYSDEHPDTKKTKKKLEIFEEAVKKILY